MLAPAGSRSSLSISNHRRDSAGMTYIYPVLSRRAGGISIGINLNPNNACNWRCIYCQVEDLQRGRAPPVDLDRLETELRTLMASINTGQFYMEYAVPESLQNIRDIAFSGNGEPTSVANFSVIIDKVLEVISGQQSLDAHALKRVIISNGSQVCREDVGAALRTWAQHGGELWFKLDAGNTADALRINQSYYTVEALQHRLQVALDCCPLWIQTCCFALDGQRVMHDVDAYLQRILAVRDHANFRGVLLYGLARPSQQTEAPRLSALSLAEMEQMAERIRAEGVSVKLTP